MALGLAAAVCTAAPAAAGVELPPFRADLRVQVVPPGALSTRAVERAAGRTKHRVFVVVLRQAHDGAIEDGHVSETEDAIEAVWTAWRTDPAFDAEEDVLVVLALDEREVRVRTGSRWDAELQLHTTALESLIDTWFLPHARAGNLDRALAELVRGLDEAIEEGLQVRREGRQRRVVFQWVVAVAGVLLLLGVVGAVATFRRRRYRFARAEFESEAAGLERKLDHAEKEWAEFRIDQEVRDKVVQLRMKGPRTLTLAEEVTRRMDEIAVGLDGLRGHLRKCRERARAAGWLDASALRAARAALAEPFVFDTGQAQHMLFDGDRRTVTIEPAAFMRELERTYEEARAGWQKLRDAVEASLRTARQDFPTDDLDVMRSRLEAAGLPAVWLAHHPLDKDPQGEWTRLDALRQADPVAYLEQLFGRLDAQAALEADLAVLADAVGEARRARLEALAIDAGDLDTVVSDPARDPAAATADAEQVTAMLEMEIQGGEDAERAVATAHAARDAWREVGRRKLALRETVRNAAEQVAEAERKVGELRTRLVAGQARILQAAGRHAPQTLLAAWREMSEATEDVDQAEAAAAEARRKLEARDHVGAEAAARTALRERGEVLADLDELAGVLEKLNAARHDTEALFRELDRERDRRQRQLEAYAGYAPPDALAAGDAARRDLQARWAAESSGPVDWTARLEELHAVLELWNAGAAKARTAFETAQAKLAAEEAARQQEEAEAAAMNDGGLWEAVFGSSIGRHYGGRHYGGHHWGGGFRPGGTRGGGRSGGRSFSGGGRSGGRSFSGGGRSGGRRF